MSKNHDFLLNSVPAQGGEKRLWKILKFPLHNSRIPVMI